jgi:hypothetical protein
MRQAPHGASPLRLTRPVSLAGHQRNLLQHNETHSIARRQCGSRRGDGAGCSGPETSAETVQPIAEKVQSNLRPYRCHRRGRANCDHTTRDSHFRVHCGHSVDIANENWTSGMRTYTRQFNSTLVGCGCRFLKFVSYHDALTCSVTLANSCHFFQMTR